MLSLQKSVGGPQPFDTRARWRVADGRHDSQRGKFRQTWARTPNSFPGCFEWKWMTVVRASQKVLRPRCAQNPLALDHEQGVDVPTFALWSFQSYELLELVDGFH